MKQRLGQPDLVPKKKFLHEVTDTKGHSKKSTKTDS